MTTPAPAPQQPGTPAQQPPAQPVTRDDFTLVALQHTSVIRDTLQSLLHRLDDEVLPELPAHERIVADRFLNEFLDVARRARFMGVDRAVFQAARDLLDVAIWRKAPGNGNGPQQQPANGTGPQPAADGTADQAAAAGTGPQPEVSA